MDSTTIEFLLHDIFSHTEIYYSVLSADDIVLTKVNTLPAAFIVNTETSWEPGAHWLAMYIPKEGPAEFFDSLGHSPVHYDLNFQTFLLQIKSSFIYNRDRLQSFGSNTCGLFCLYFLKKRIHNMSYIDILKTFSTNLINNDETVMEEFPFLKKSAGHITLMND